MDWSNAQSIYYVVMFSNKIHIRLYCFCIIDLWTLHKLQEMPEKS